MILSKRRFGVAALASMFLVACGGGGGDGTEPTGEAPITPDSPGKIAGLGAFGGTPQGPEFQLPAGIKLASSLTGLYVGPSGDSVGQISLSASTTAALPAATVALKDLVVHDGRPVDKIMGSGWAVTIKVPLENTTSSPIEVTFPAGHILRSKVADFQHAVLLKAVKVTVPANSKITVALAAYCGNEKLAGSAPEATYDWGVVSSSSTLRELTDLLKNKKINYEEFAPNFTGYWETAVRLQTILHNLTDKGVALTEADRAWIAGLPNS